jgi:hypothetical protein
LHVLLKRVDHTMSLADNADERFDASLECGTRYPIAFSSTVRRFEPVDCERASEMPLQRALPSLAAQQLTERRSPFKL